MDQFVLADCGIRQLYARFVDAVWRQDADVFSNCFAEDGEWKIAGMNMRGREEIAAGCNNLLGRCERIHLLVGPPILEVDGNTAIGRLNMTEFAKIKDGTTAMTIGYYHDRYVETGGQWYFQSRHWSMKYRGTPDLMGVFYDTLDYGAFPARPDPDEETFVRKS